MIVTYVINIRSDGDNFALYFADACRRKVAPGEVAGVACVCVGVKLFTESIFSHLIGFVVIVIVII